jgi:hypothetical protein
VQAISQVYIKRVLNVFFHVLALLLRIVYTGSKSNQEELFMKRIITVILLAFIVLTGLFLHAWKTASAAAPTAHQQNSSCSSWTVVSSPNPGTSTNFLNGVATIGADNLWAVGSYSNGSGSFPLIEHRSKSKWTVVSSPNIAGSLSAIAAISANNIWAVGENDSSNMQETLVEHRNGKVWKIVTSPNFAPSGNTLASISISSAKDIWAAGTTTSTSSTSGDRPLIEHWNGSRWSISSSPALSGRLFSVAAIKSNDVWAVGENLMPNFTGSLAEHWNGKQWRIVSSPNLGPAINVLNSVVKISADTVWAAGDETNSPAPSAEYTPLIERWNGTQWSVVSSLLQGTSDFVNGMVAVSAKNITVVGDYRSSLDPQGPYFTLVEHWNGTQWSTVSSPSPGAIDSDLLAAARISGTNHIWAVGYIYDGTTYHTLVEKSC